MGLLTKQDIDNFYIDYKTEEVVFTKTITSIFGLQPKHIYIKFKDIQRPCIVYSSSMIKAKVIASLPEEILSKLKDENSINLRYAVNNEDKKNDMLFFFIKCKIVEITPYKPDQNLFIIDLDYMNKPPETLIVLLGRLLEAKKNSIERCDERINIDKEAAIKIGLKSTGVNLTIDNIPRQAIIRDLSFGGIKILLAGNAKFLMNKAIKIVINHKDNNELTILGKSIRTESLVNRKDICAMAIQFNKESVPIEYNLIINEYLKSHKIMNKIKDKIEAKELEEKSN